MSRGPVDRYTDNAINVALPGTYKFFEKVFDTMIAYYQEAGAPLEQIHIGGDEVPYYESQGIAYRHRN